MVSPFPSILCGTFQHYSKGTADIHKALTHNSRLLDRELNSGHFEYKEIERIIICDGSDQPIDWVNGVRFTTGYVFLSSPPHPYPIPCLIGTGGSLHATKLQKRDTDNISV
jgi:hypothetical protein